MVKDLTNFDKNVIIYMWYYGEYIKCHITLHIMGIYWISRQNLDGGDVFYDYCCVVYEK